MRDVGWFPDGDVDGVANAADNCSGVSNPGQEDGICPSIDKPGSGPLQP
jgi:hypothetical protein